MFAAGDADPRWAVSTSFAVGSAWSMASSAPWLAGPWGDQAPLTVVLGDEAEEVPADLFTPS